MREQVNTNSDRGWGGWELQSHRLANNRNRNGGQFQRGIYRSGDGAKRIQRVGQGYAFRLASGNHNISGFSVQFDRRKQPEGNTVAACKRLERELHGYRHREFGIAIAFHCAHADDQRSAGFQHGLISECDHRRGRNVEFNLHGLDHWSEWIQRLSAGHAHGTADGRDHISCVPI